MSAIDQQDIALRDKEIVVFDVSREVGIGFLT